MKWRIALAIVVVALVGGVVYAIHIGNSVAGSTSGIAGASLNPFEAFAVGLSDLLLRPVGWLIGGISRC